MGGGCGDSVEQDIQPSTGECLITLPDSTHQISLDGSASESVASNPACCEYAACDIPYKAMHTAVRTGVCALSVRFTDFATCRAVLDCLMLHPLQMADDDSRADFRILRHRRARRQDP